jgi:hypothetical protein
MCASNKMLVNHGILHGDLKWDNIGYRLVDGKYNIVLFDFGKSKYIDLNNVDIIQCVKVDTLFLLADTLLLIIADDLKKTMYEMLMSDECPSSSLMTPNMNTKELRSLSDKIAILYQTNYQQISCLSECY